MMHNFHIPAPKMINLLPKPSLDQNVDLLTVYIMNERNYTPKGINRFILATA